MPVANGFLTEDAFEQEAFYDLSVARCSNCGMTQLVDVLDRDHLFHSEYAFYSSTSRYMATHFESHAHKIRERLERKVDPFVVEIGSNDGIFLRHFANSGLRCIGVEPSENVAEVARRAGVATLAGFFDSELASVIENEHGPADVIVAANVMCHIQDLDSVFTGIRGLLSKDGVLIFEDPYLGDILEKTSYDQIYDEHAYYFSLASIEHLATRHGLQVIEVEDLGVHGGSMRYTLAHDSVHPTSTSVGSLREREIRCRMHEASTYSLFRKRVEKSRDELTTTIRSLRADGRRVVGYGATSKSTTVTNYCGFTSADIEFISDTTPIKQGKFSPGAHIPVKPPSEFRNDYPDVAVLFAWNHAREIQSNESEFIKAGGKWLVYVPEVKISP